MRTRKPLVIEPENERFTLESGKEVVIAQRNKPKQKGSLCSATRAQLFWYVAKQMNTLWSPEAKERYNDVDGRRSIGPGEISYRIDNNLSLGNLQGTKSCDFPEHDCDAKEWKSIRFGACANSVWVTSAIELSVDRLSKKIYETIELNGERMTYSVLMGRGLPGYLLQRFETGNETEREIVAAIKDKLQPTKFIKYGSIVAVDLCGYVKIERNDYDKALNLVGISKSEPTFTLSRSFLEKKARELRIAELQKSPNAISVDPNGEILNEGILVTNAEPTPHLSSADVNCLSP
jgi:hypothetical protein